MIAPAWRAARRLLCVRLDSLGDVLMCTPAMRALRARLPDCRLTLLSSASGAALAPHAAMLDDALVYDAPWLKHSAPHAATHDLALVHSLAARRFDGAVIFTSYSQSALPAALLCQLAGIPLRLAYCREKPYGLLSDWVPETEPHRPPRHEVQRQLDLVGTLGCATERSGLSFSVGDGARARVQAVLEGHGVRGDRPWLLLHPGASAASRRYPAAHWRSVLGLLRGRSGCPLVVSGSAAEVTLVGQITAGMGSGVVALAGQLSLEELGAAIAMASVVICNNTGPAHMAAALGTPLVSLYALTNPQHTPWQVPHRLLFHDVPCRYCQQSVCAQGHHDCLARVEPARVADAALALLSEAWPGAWPAGPPSSGSGLDAPLPA